MSQEYFSHSSTRLNILSYKDKRVFGSSSSGLSTYHIHQATVLDDGLCILHDGWIFKSEPQFCHHGKDISPTSFGITTDLLISGLWIVGDACRERQIKSRLLQEYAAVCRRHAKLTSLARYDRFSDAYKGWLGSRLETLNASIAIPNECDCTRGGAQFLYGPMTSIDYGSPRLRNPRIRRLPANTTSIHEKEGCGADRLSKRSAFTSNSESWRETVCVNALEDSRIDVFCKRSNFLNQEISGATQAALHYPHVQVPSICQQGHLLYPFFRGRTEAEHRLSYVQNGCSEQLTLVLNTELVKTEDMLRAYQRSLQIVSDDNTSSHQPIHRFYHSRLADFARFNEFYSAGIDIHEHVIPLSVFLDAKFKDQRGALSIFGTDFSGCHKAAAPDLDL